MVVLALVAAISASKFGWFSFAETPAAAQCVIKPFREAEAASLIKDGAVIVYNRTAGPLCVDELFAIYPDGRVLGNDGANEVENRLTLLKWSKCSLGSVGNTNGSLMPSTADISPPAGNALRTMSAFLMRVRKRLYHRWMVQPVCPAGYSLTLAVIRSVLPEINPAP